MINSELQKLNDWFIANKLSVNVSKSCFIVFTGNRRRYDPESFKVLLNNNKLTQVKSTKFLGVLIDENLSWNQHVELVVSKISKGAGLIFKLKQSLPRYALITLYNSLILPYLNYCTMIWAANNSCRLNKILLVQKKVVRTVCRMHRIAMLLHFSRNAIFLELTTFALCRQHSLCISILTIYCPLFLTSILYAMHLYISTLPAKVIAFTYFLLPQNCAKITFDSLDPRFGIH